MNNPFDPAQLMKLVQEAQGKMQEHQRALKSKIFEGQAGGGLVTATVDGQGRLMRVSIDRTVVNPDDTGMLQDLIAGAVRAAQAEATTAMESFLSSLTGGIKLPGLF